MTAASKLDHLLLELKGLVYARAILASRGAPPESIRVHDAEIERVRDTLAELVETRAA
jgi:hypothetical protein